jgi:hypothetical protein
MTDNKKKATLAAAGALLVPTMIATGSGIALADDHGAKEVKRMGKVSVNADNPSAGTLETPDGFTCENWTAKVVGKKKFRDMLVVSPSAASAASCADGMLNWSVALAEGFDKKANLVVKFRVTSDDGSATRVESLVVKVNRDASPSHNAEGQAHKKDKPSKGKPAKDASVDDDQDADDQDADD